ncbi:hypothetical protein QTL95_11880 [Rhizobium sp. S152]|uniref:hypothetical protein n=1 Tax=Rhizobium sp. S152 TaxID=3055038 RepID=UPI0025A9DF90|nr:hypothetical protein [Rhizobium sp. S152]MDM9626600.1 hypothetical protein [Rhizobium sp. S152]
MTEEATENAEKARIDELFRAPLPWYSEPKIVRRLIILSAVGGAMIFFLSEYLF